MLMLLVFATLLLAVANGANDVSKGISTLFGSGVSKYRTAVAWGTLWTVAGGLIAAFASQRLVATFSGNGLLHDKAIESTLLLSVALGAIGWLVFATATGLPVSTTHSLVGALIGTALISHGLGGIAWPAVTTRIIVPLLLSPLISAGLVFVVLPLFARAFRRANQYCVCIEQRSTAVALPNGVAMREMVMPQVTAGTECATAVARFNAVDSLHWFSAGATSFFRGVNDSPKILALGIGAGAAYGISTVAFYVLIAAAMAVGSLTAGFRVTRTLARKVTPISAENGFAANAVTAALVGLASLWALPVSTTHVSTGAIVGIGVAEGRAQVRWKMVGEIIFAWLVTLPASALLAGLTAFLLAG